MVNSIHIAGELKTALVRKGIFLVLLHANRLPPHIGMMIDFTYHSLSIKGAELNIRGEALLKNISLRKIATVMMRIKKHPVFSNEHLGECFAEMVRQHESLGAGGNTCLSPVKLFFEEFYAIDKGKIDLVFDLLAALRQNNFAEDASGAHLGPLKENIFYLQPYKRQDLDRQIEAELLKLKR